MNYFIEVSKSSHEEKFFIDLREISHISESVDGVNIYFKNGIKETFKNIKYDDIKKLITSLYEG